MHAPVLKFALHAVGCSLCDFQRGLERVVRLSLRLLFWNRLSTATHLFALKVCIPIFVPVDERTYAWKVLWIADYSTPL